MDFQITTLVLGPLETNAYVVVGDGVCWVFDPGLSRGELPDFLRDKALSPQRILLTHGHGDHIAGAGELKKAFPQARLCCPAGDAFMLEDSKANLSMMFGINITAPPADDLLESGQTLQMGSLEWTVLDASGHSPGGAAYLCRQQGILISGDALLAGSIGRTDTPGGSASRLLNNIRSHMLTLPDFTRVLPGHGPETTIGAERLENPFLRGGW